MLVSLPRGRRMASIDERARLRARFRLMRRRARRRFGWAVVFSIVSAATATLMDWAGVPTGLGPPPPFPQHLSELWWHLPLYAAIGFVVVLLWPWRDPGE